MKHCISCGKKGARWPKYDPQVCTARCAAWGFIMYASVGDFEAAHCPYCGGPGAPCEHKSGCVAHPLNHRDEEEDAYYGRGQFGEEA